MLGVVAAGAVGALGRAELAGLAERVGRSARAGTLTANLLGTALLAVLVTRVQGDLLLVLGGGLCGALTTFSTWVVQEVPSTASRGPAGRPSPADEPDATKRGAARATMSSLARLALALSAGVALAVVLLRL